MLERQKKQIKNLKEQSNSKIEEKVVEVIYVIFFIAYNLFELYMVYLLGNYYGMVIEILLILISFFISKALFGIPLHYENNFICFGLAMSSFYICIKSTFSIHISIFMSVIIGVLLGAITSYIATYLYKSKQKLKKRNLVKELVELDLDANKIQAICIKNGLDEEIGDIVLFRLNHNEDLTCYEFTIDRMTLNRKLNKFLKVAK